MVNRRTHKSKPRLTSVQGCIVHCEVTLEEFAGCPRAGEGGLVRAVMTVGGWMQAIRFLLFN